MSSTTQAAIGFGTFFKVRTSTGPDVYETIGQQTNVTPYGIAVDSIDASHEDSEGAWREFIAGLKDAGEASLDIHYVPGGAAEALLLSLLGTTQVCRSVFPSGARVDYSGFITGMSPEAPMDDKMVMSVTVKLSGPMEPTAAAQPANSVIPAISGLAQVGQTLTAFPGIWTNEPTSFTYQWKKDGAAISGATAKTYSPVIGEIDAAITVTVTGVNSAGSASATSAATPDVIAA